MKITDLLSEAPYLHQGSMSVNLDGTYSANTIKRDFDSIGEVKVTEGIVKLLLQKNKAFVAGVLDDSLPDGRFKILFHLEFKKHHELKNIPKEIAGKPVLQVNSVQSILPAPSIGIASTVYKILVNMGYAVLSDSTQFDPGKGLWEKLAGEQSNRVIVTDVENGTFKDEHGNTIKYNGKNIPEQDIWSSGSDYTGQYRVLVLY